MNAVQLMGEVRKIPGYGNPQLDGSRLFYRRVQETIDARRDQLPIYTMEGSPFPLPTGEPFWKIQAVLDSIVLNIQHDFLSRNGLRDEKFTFVLFEREMVCTLDDLINQRMKQGDFKENDSSDMPPGYAQDIDFIRQMPYRAAKYLRRMERMSFPDETELEATSGEILPELKALRELIEVYARAKITQYDSILKFLLEGLDENIPGLPHLDKVKQQIGSK